MSRRSVVDAVAGGALFALDRMTKNLALSRLVYGAPVPVFRAFGIDGFWTLTPNQGAAWGAFEEYSKALFLFRIVFGLALLVLYWRWNGSAFGRVALVAVLAGALGNIFDTASYGHVIDMIHLVFWGINYPVFNVADMCICCGAATLLGEMALYPRK